MSQPINPRCRCGGLAAVGRRGEPVCAHCGAYQPSSGCELTDQGYRPLGVLQGVEVWSR